MNFGGDALQSVILLVSSQSSSPSREDTAVRHLFTNQEQDSPDPKSAGTSVLDFSASRLWEINICCLGDPVKGINTSVIVAQTTKTRSDHFANCKYVELRRNLDKVPRCARPPEIVVIPQDWARCWDMIKCELKSSHSTTIKFLGCQVPTEIRKSVCFHYMFKHY